MQTQAPSAVHCHEPAKAFTPDPITKLENRAIKYRARSHGAFNNPFRPCSTVNDHE